MIDYRETNRNPSQLKLGCKLDYVSYSWRPYDGRLPEHKQDYDRLLSHMQTNGITNPLIVFRDCVVVGMRRCEMAVKLGIDSVRCWEITADISNDRQPTRVFELRDQYKKVSY